MEKNKVIIAIIIASFLSLGVFQPFFIITGKTSKVEASTMFRPLPFEDAQLGRNSHAYLGRIQTPTEQEKEIFVKQITDYGIQASKQYGMPASAIIGMSIIESGYGTTRTAHFANNLFGIKVWGYNPPNAWQLKGQPDEDLDRVIPIIADFGNDRIVFDETQRRDNWYRKFDSYQHSVHFLTGTLLVNQRYGFAIKNYHNRIADGWDSKDASKKYLFEIANAGYNHLGGEYYRNIVGKIMDQWDLYRYDVVEEVKKEELPPITGVNHSVVSGDTLWKLSIQYGTTIDQIKSANNLTSDMLFIGQVLFIPVNPIVSEPIVMEPVVPTKPEPVKEETAVEPQPVVVEEPVVENTRGNGNGNGNNNGGGNNGNANGGGPKKR